MLRAWLGITTSYLVMSSIANQLSELNIVNFNSFLFHLFFILGPRVRVSMMLYVTVTKWSHNVTWCHISVTLSKMISYSIFYTYWPYK